MYIKWIICNVDSNKKTEFAIAQESWNKTKKSKGFIAQIGGWNVNNSDEACIVSFWKNKSALDKFMKEIHNVIFKKNNQIKTYETITVLYYNLDNPNDTIERFKKNINNARSIRTVKTCEDVNLQIKFSNKLLWFENKILNNSSINLVESWKII